MMSGWSHVEPRSGCKVVRRVTQQQDDTPFRQQMAQQMRLSERMGSACSCWLIQQPRCSIPCLVTYRS